MNTIYYHNPRCSKSREVLKYLQDKNAALTIKNYLKEGLDNDEIVGLSEKLGLHPSEFVRKQESAYKTLGSDSFSVEEWAEIIKENPILLERPILVNGDTAIICRPTSRILSSPYYLAL